MDEIIVDDPPCDPVCLYEYIAIMGQGTNGTVWKAKNKRTDQLVAIKYAHAAEGEPHEDVQKKATYELTLLQQLKHENVIELLDTFTLQGQTALVLEFMPMDLDNVMKDYTIKLGASEIKSYAQMVLKGMAYLHNLGICHFDLKSDNILINSAGVLKIADFGAAAYLNQLEEGEFVDSAVVLSCRPPELLLRMHQFGQFTDLWAIAVLIIELLTRAYIFSADSEIASLNKIFDILGTPTARNWPQAREQPTYLEGNFAKRRPKGLKALVPRARPGMLSVLKKLFVLDPVKRWSCEDVLQMAYFKPKTRSKLNLKRKRNFRQGAAKKSKK